MLLFDHYIAASPIHGLGVFTSERIATGAKVWEFNPLIDRCISASDLELLPSHVRKWVRERAHFSEEHGGFIVGCDGDSFMNHSDEPNVTEGVSDCFAIRDIAPDEEVTCDYRLCQTMMEHSTWGSAQ